jgi:hypothetical protein
MEADGSRLACALPAEGSRRGRSPRRPERSRVRFSRPGDDRPDSDIDLLVDVAAGRTLLDVIGLEQDLHEILGRRVDVLTEKGLSPYLQQRILAEATSL